MERINRKEVERFMELISHTLADKISYNRFHVQRIKDILGRKKTLMNHMSEKLIDFNDNPIYWIIHSFAELQGFRDMDIDDAIKYFEKEIKTIEDVKEWLVVAETQLKKRGLL